MTALTAPEGVGYSDLYDFMETMWSLKVDDDGFYPIGAYEAYLLNIILRWSAEEDLAVVDLNEGDKAELEADLAEINTDLALINKTLTDTERGRALSQLGDWWDKLGYPITVCKV